MDDVIFKIGVYYIMKLFDDLKKVELLQKFCLGAMSSLRKADIMEVSFSTEFKPTNGVNETLPINAFREKYEANFWFLILNMFILMYIKEYATDHPEKADAVGNLLLSNKFKEIFINIVNECNFNSIVFSDTDPTRAIRKIKHAVYLHLFNSNANDSDLPPPNVRVSQNLNILPPPTGNRVLN